MAKVRSTNQKLDQHIKNWITSSAGSATLEDKSWAGLIIQLGPSIIRGHWTEQV